MFQKKDYIFSETMGVCRITDVTKLSTKKGEPILYYIMRSVKDTSKVSYIPVENHSVVLRELISKEEARKKSESGIELKRLEKEEIEFVLKAQDIA